MSKRSVLMLVCVLVLGPVWSVWAGLDPSLIAWWPLDEGAGTVATDSSGNGNDGTLEGGALWVPGVLETALQFNGSDSYVNAPHIPFDSRSFTIALWINPGQTSSDQICFGQVQANETDTSMHFRIVSGGTVRMGFYSNDLDSPGGAVEVGNWYHLACWYDFENQNRRIYINGEMVAEAGSTPYLGSTGDTHIGQWDGGEYFTGMIDDVQIYDRPLQDAEVVKIMSGLEDQSLSHSPSPADEAIDIPRDVALSWGAGEFAAAHDVYFGTSFDDVNDGAGTLLSQGQTATNFDPDGVLTYGQTYYWRIDEVNAAPDNTIFRGEIWNFTVEPVAYPIEGVLASSDVASDVGAGPEKMVDGSGLNADDQHSTDSVDMWLTTTTTTPFSVLYEFDGIYKLHEMLVWNYNVQFEPVLGFGLKDVTVEYSADGVEWTVLGDVELARATAKVGYAANTTVEFGGVPAQYIRLTVNSGWGPMGQFGLSEVRFTYVPAQPREPQPGDGAVDASVEALLGWRAGREAVSHEVSFGTDPNALALAGTADVASYNPGTLDLETTYYWQVSEVNSTDEVSVWEGAVWTFATQAFLVVDDFESYTDDIDGGGAIFLTWIDGYEITGNGSTVGHLGAPFAEQTIVKSGIQSMPLSFDNTGTSMSEAEVALDQDWTTSGIKSLAIAFAGAEGNSGQLYVKINGAKVLYDGSAADLAKTAWQAWNIDLSTVGGNLSSVTSLVIGIEGAGATGVVYIDDIRLYPKTPEYITPADPGADGLVAYYAFEGNADDSSGNGHHGTLNGDVQFATGYEGSALDCDGVDDYVSTDKSASDLGIAGNSPRTISSWVYTRAFANGAIYDVGNRDTAQDFSLRTLDTGDNNWRVQYWGGDSDFTYPTLNEWVQFTHVHDGAYTKIYANGLLIVDWEKTIDTTDDNPFQIGLYGWPGNYFNGLIDEVRLYNRALSADEALGLFGQMTPVHKAF